MPSLGAMLLATMLFPSPAPTARGAPLEVRESAFALELDLESFSLERELRAMLPLGERLLRQDNWIGVSLDDGFALLVDVRMQGVPSSPDPARPAARGAFTAALGIALTSFGN